jgi:hypothetical protein
MILIVRLNKINIFYYYFYLLGIQFLVKISTDLGLPDREMYEAELKKVNKLKEIQFQVLF